MQKGCANRGGVKTPVVGTYGGGMNGMHSLFTDNVDAKAHSIGSAAEQPFKRIATSLLLWVR